MLRSEHSPSHSSSRAQVWLCAERTQRSRVRMHTFAWQEFLKVSGGWFKRSSERIAELVSACLLNVVDVLTTLVFKASFSPSEAT